MKNIIYKFPNGAKILYRKNKINKATGLHISFRCGSQCDGNIPGLAHFCEHMFFTGTKNQNKEEVSENYFKFINVNAFTNDSVITFKGEIFTEELPEYLNTVCKMITKSTFTKEAIEKEKKVVIQEIVRSKDDFGLASLRQLNYQIYDKEFFKQGVLGNEDSINKITRKDVVNFIRKYFVANNCTIYISSPLSFFKVKKIITKNLISKLSVAQNFKPVDLTIALPMTNRSKFDLINKEIDKNFINLVFKVPIKVEDIARKASLNILCSIMNDIKFGVINELRLQKGLTYSSSVDYDCDKETATLCFSTECSKQNIKECVSIVIEYLKNLYKNGVTQEAIDKEKREIKYYNTVRTRTLANTIKYLTTYDIYDKFVLHKVFNNAIKKVTIESINEILQLIFSDLVFVCCVYGDASSKDVYNLKELKNLLKI